VNEAEDRAAVLLAKKAVVVRKAAAVLGNFSNEGVALFIVVMKVHLDITYAEMYYLPYAVEDVSPILFLRVEKAVLRTLAIAISGSIVGNPRPSVTPFRDAGQRGFN
jgi:hypothetical protein